MLPTYLSGVVLGSHLKQTKKVIIIIIIEKLLALQFLKIRNCKNMCYKSIEEENRKIGVMREISFDNQCFFCEILKICSTRHPTKMQNIAAINLDYLDELEDSNGI